ncbi:MAG TPA: rhomboid family intramembrane serine protease [Solirubrobacterales bacterium]
MLPLKDNNPTSRFPVVTVALIVVCVAVFIWQLSFPTNQRLEGAGFGSIDQSSLEYGAIPYRITHPSTGDCAVGAVSETQSGFVAGVVCPGTKDYAEATARSRANPGSNLGPFTIDEKPWWVTLFTSMFMHGGFLHIAGNMLFLWVFGNNIEDRLGRVKFLLFYLLAGLIAVYTQSLIDTGSTAPTIGASGAIAGVLGAYALLYPRARVLTLIFIIFFVTLVEIPALILLALWFILQFVPALGQVAVGSGGDQGVAYFAHVGGFVFGLAVAAVILSATRQREPQPRLPVY